MRFILWAVFWVGLVLTIASFGGKLHGIGDSLAVFRHFWALMAAISSFLLLRGHLRFAGLGVLAAGLAALPMAAGFLHPNAAPDGRYSFYQKNLLYNGSDRQGIIADMQSTGPDFISMEELGDDNMVIYNTLAKTYATHLMCDSRRARAGRVAILSRFAQVAGGQSCLGGWGGAAVKVVTPDGPVWAVALHLHWPFPFSQAAQVRQLVAQLESLDAPIVLGGDFNMVPWSNTMRLLEKATKSRRAGPVLLTYYHPHYPLHLPIDHILVPSGRGHLEPRPFLGSDHKGLLLRFDLRPQ